MTNRPVLRTGKHIALAEMLSEDQPLFQQWLSESELLRDMIDDPRIPTLEDQKRWFERTKQPDRRMLSILALPDHQLIGNGGFVQINPKEKSAVFRITIGKADAWGKGYGSEATGLLLRFGFETLGLTTITLTTRVDNDRALKLYAKFGFERKAESFSQATNRPILALSLTREKFLPLFT